MLTRRFAAISFAAPLALALMAFAPAALASGVTPAQATPVQREQAQSRFAKGKALFSSGKYEAALVEFNGSLDIVVSPNTRLYVGRCLRELGRLVPAYVELGRAAVEAKELTREDPRYEKTAEAAHDERARLEPKLGFVTVTVEHPGEATTLKVAHDEVRRGGWSEPVPVVPGSSEITVETPGRPPVTKTIQVAAGEKQAVSIDAAGDPSTGAGATTTASAEGADKAASERRPLRQYAFLAGGVALAGLATFAIAGTMANGTYSDLEESCGPRPCPPGREDDISAGRTQQTIANIGLGVFAVGTAAAVTLWFVGAPKAQDRPASARVSAGLGYVGVGGTF